MWNNCKGQVGFTLLEIVVALAIFAIIISLIYQAYIGTYRNIGIAEAQAEIYDMARTTMIRIIEDLESTYVPRDSNDPLESDNADVFKGQEDFFEGRRADRIRFFSRSHIDISETLIEGGDAKIAYYPLLKEDQSISLYRSDTPDNLEWPEENTKGWIICEGLYSISFTYTDKNGDIHDNWDESIADPKNKLPSSINITLEFIDRDNPEKPITFFTAVALPLAN
jgi:general secretion pathway protein J